MSTSIAVPVRVTPKDTAARRRAWRWAAVYLARRLGVFLLSVWGAFTITFIFVHLIPGDPVEAYINRLVDAGGPTLEVTQKLIEAYKKDMGYGGTIFEQYWRYLYNVIIRWDFGISFVAYPKPAQDLIFRAMPYTIGLLATAVIISWALGLVVGAMLAWTRGGWFSWLMVNVALVVSHMPFFFMSFLLLLMLGYGLAVLPTRGAYDVLTTPGLNLEFISGLLKHAILPAGSLVLVSASGWMLSTRAVVIGVLGEDYLLFAEAKGLPRLRILLRHILRNALLPQVTALGISLGFVVNGSYLVEWIFAYPGVGMLFVQAASLRDLNVMQGVVLMSVFAVLFANLIVDLTLPLLDPRVRQGGRGR